MIKNGTRLQSQVCDTQVIVVRSADSLDDLRCGESRWCPWTLRSHPMPTWILLSPGQHDGQTLRRRHWRRSAGDQGRSRGVECR